MNQNSELWSVEYSIKQNCFHVDLLSSILEKNQRAVLEGRNAGYQLIGICESHNAACEFIKKWEAQTSYWGQ